MSIHNIEKITKLPFKPSTLETIDYAMYDWIQKQMDIFCTTNKGFKKVPLFELMFFRDPSVHSLFNDPFVL